MKKIFCLVVLLCLICGCGKDINQQIKECFLQVAEHNIKEAERICGEVIPKDKTGVSEFLLVSLQGEKEIDKDLEQRLEEILKRNILVKFAKGAGLLRSDNEETKKEGAKICREIFNGDKLNKIQTQLKSIDKDLSEAINQIIIDTKTDLSIYLVGQEDQKQVNDGIKYLKELDTENIEFPTYILGLLYYAGIVVDGDYNQSFNYFTKLSKLGYPDALFMLGVMNFMGHGVEENNLTAYKYWTDAANKGSILAKLVLEYDDFKIYTAKMSSIKMISGKDDTYQNSIDYITWIRSEEGKQFVHETTMTPQEIDEHMVKFLSLSNIGIDFAVSFTSAYLMSIGAIKESVEIYDNLHKGKKAK